MCARVHEREGFVAWVRPLFGLFLILGMILVSAACGGDDAGLQGPAKLDACSILPAEEVAVVLDAPRVGTQAEQHGDDGFWMSSCRYQAEGADGMNQASLLIRPHHNEGGAEQAYHDYGDELVRELGETARLSTVEGLGQKAGWQSFGTSVGQLAVFQGPYQLIVTAPETAGQDQLANCRALAEHALMRISLR